jgi:hypothetical protein
VFTPKRVESVRVHDALRVEKLQRNFATVIAIRRSEDKRKAPSLLVGGGVIVHQRHAHKPAIQDGFGLNGVY